MSRQFTCSVLGIITPANFLLPRIVLLQSRVHGRVPSNSNKACFSLVNDTGTTYVRFSIFSLSPPEKNSLINISYQYIIDGYHVSHDPSQASTLEPTTSRMLNILDVPRGGSKHSSSSKESHSSSRSSKHKSSSSSKHHSSRRESRRDSLSLSVDVPKGRPLSVSQIQSPKPVTPHATKYILESDYTGVSTSAYSHPQTQTVEDLTSRFSSTTISDYSYGNYDYESSSMRSSPPSSVGSSLSSRSDSSSPSSASSFSDYSSGSACTCERYGITRGGDRVKLDCGGSRCGYSDGSSCDSGSEEEYEPRSTRRHGIVVRH